MQKNLKQILFVGYLLCYMHLSAFSQNDSLQTLINKIANSSKENSETALYQIYEIANHKDNENLMIFIKKSLEQAAIADLSPSLINDMLFYYSEQAKAKKIEESFLVMLWTLENDSKFSKPALQLQLQYYYASYFYTLKGYYYADKYCNLYLENSKSVSLPYEHDKEILNIMTLSALMDRNQNKLEDAINKFKVIIDSAKAKKQTAWLGISYGNLTYSLFLAKKYDEAIPLFEKDILLSKQSLELGSAINSEITLAEIYQSKKDKEKAFQYIDSARSQIDFLTKVNFTNFRNFLRERYSVAKILGMLYYEEADLINSNKYLAQSIILGDSLNQLKSVGEYIGVLQKFQFDKQMTEVNELNLKIKDKQQQLNQIILTAIILLITLISILFLLNKLSKVNKILKKKNHIIEEQNHALEKINADKDRLFSIISHDLRGPVTNIQALMKAFLEKRIPIQDFETLLPGIVKNTSNLSTTLDNLLTWSMSKNGIQLVPEQLNINECIKNVLALFEEQANLKKITIQNNCPEFEVFADKNHLDVILRNLLNNAIKFSYPNSSIEIDGFDHGNKIELRILDHGTGISKEQLNKINQNQIFKSATGTSGEKGSGLGLQLVKDFIEKNGGKFHLETVEQKGSTISFTIPKF